MKRLKQLDGIKRERFSDPTGYECLTNVNEKNGVTYSPPDNSGTINSELKHENGININSEPFSNLLDEVLTEIPLKLEDNIKNTFGSQAYPLEQMKAIETLNLIPSRSSISICGAPLSQIKKEDVKIQFYQLNPVKPENESTSISLSEKQAYVLNLILSKESVFFTGAAGTGKSHILRIFQDVLERSGRLSSVAFTAPTGVAACNVRGLTVHSWAGVGAGTDPLEKTVAIVSRSKEAKRRWLVTETLIIDEISMLSAELFELLSAVGSRIRQDPRPFGGLQLIISGDFFQLPPVGLGSKTRFCFAAETWKKIFNQTNMVILDKVFRQRDSTFLNILHQLRRGVVSPSTLNILSSKVQESKRQSLATKSSVRPTKLFSTNKDVDFVNSRELSTIAEAEVTYVAKDEGEEPYLRQLRAGLKAPETLVLKVGTQVMLLKNLHTSQGLVNGARGVVRAFERPKDRGGRHAMYPLVDFLVSTGGAPRTESLLVVEEVWDIRQGETILACRSQIPLMLAWAISIHKSQGMTIPLLEVSFSGMFEYGQGYVALSRATDLQGLMLHSFQSNGIKAHPQVKEFYNSLGYDAESELTDEALVSTTIEALVQTSNDFDAQKKYAIDINTTKEPAWIPSHRMAGGDASNRVDTPAVGTKRAAMDAGGEYDEWLELEGSASYVASGRDFDHVSRIVKAEGQYTRQSTSTTMAPVAAVEVFRESSGALASSFVPFTSAKKNNVMTAKLDDMSIKTESVRTTGTTEASGYIAKNMWYQSGSIGCAGGDVSFDNNLDAGASALDQASAIKSESKPSSAHAYFLPTPKSHAISHRPLHKNKIANVGNSAPFSPTTPVSAAAKVDVFPRSDGKPRQLYTKGPPYQPPPSSSGCGGSRPASLSQTASVRSNTALNANGAIDPDISAKPSVSYHLTSTRRYSLPTPSPNTGTSFVSGTTTLGCGPSAPSAVVDLTHPPESYPTGSGPSPGSTGMTPPTSLQSPLRGVMVETMKTSLKQVDEDAGFVYDFTGVEEFSSVDPLTSSRKSSSASLEPSILTPSRSVLANALFTKGVLQKNKLLRDEVVQKTLNSLLS